MGQQKVFFEQLPVPSGVQPSVDPSIPKIAWNRWTTKNFTIHSIDFDQGEYLFHNIEQIKAWCLKRWGLPDIQFGSECRIFCAPNVEMMQKLFNINGSYGEVREVDGKITISYLWLILDGRPAEVVPSALTMICLKEFNSQFNLNLGWWLYRGMSVLNGNVSQIKRNVALAGAPKTLAWKPSVHDFFAITEAEWKKLTPENKQIFDAKAAVLCLFIRKEYGQKKFHYFLKYDNYEHDISDYMGFNKLPEFDGALTRFTGFLAEDVKRNTTPESYLQIENK